MARTTFEATDHCATRLRLTLADTSKVDEAKIKSTGAVATRVLNKKERASHYRDRSTICSRCLSSTSKISQSTDRVDKKALEP